MFFVRQSVFVCVFPGQRRLTSPALRPTFPRPRGCQAPCSLCGCGARPCRGSAPRAPCGHVGAGVGPADADAARVRRLPAVGAAAHPVVVVAQRHHADAELVGQLHGAGHGVAGVQRAEAALAVPALHGTEAGGAHGTAGDAFIIASSPGRRKGRRVGESTKKSVRNL